MIERKFIHVGGTPKGGKTTLIERLLEAYDGFALVARCIPGRQPPESTGDKPGEECGATALSRRGSQRCHPVPVSIE